MLLCDIGNTSYHFYSDKGTYKKESRNFQAEEIQERVYYICVHPKIKNELKGLQNWIDLGEYVDYTPYYETMGIDRVVACEAVDDGLIVDAGSAITVDLMKGGVFCGGFIYPGVQAMQKCYANISSALEYSFNYELDLDIMPKNSQDALSYGFLKPLYRELISHKKQIYLTGGDAHTFAKFLPDASIDQELLFKGMKKIIQKAGLC